MQITILTKPNGEDGEVPKRFVDGVEVDGYAKFPEHWWASMHDANVRELYHLYRRPHEVRPGLIDSPRSVVALGHPPDTGLVSRRNWAFAPSDVLVIDGDGIPYPEGFDDATLIDNPGETILAVLASIGLQGLECLVVLSSKAGMVGKFRGHIFVQLAEHYLPSDLNDMMKELKDTHPWLDPIMSPSHLFFSSRPRVDVEHLPERVFHVEGASFLPATRAARGFVKLSKPAMRGTTTNLHRLNADRIAANEFVTEECWNFIVTCKNARKSEDETVELLRAEFTRLNASREVWRKMWKVIKREDGSKADPILGDARRMYRQVHGGSKPVYGEPAYREPETTLRDATNALRDAIEEQVDSEGVFLNKVSLGVGKTHEIVDYVTRNDKKVLILAPNHERCDEIVSRLESARQQREERVASTGGQFDNTDTRSRAWEAWRGRSAEGMCKRLDVVNKAFSAGVNVARDVCGISGEDVPRCPMWESCDYWDQVDQFWRANWVAPVAMISHLSRLAAGADMVIVDEGCVDLLAGQSHFDLDEISRPTGDERLDELSRKAHRALLDDERNMTFDELTEALNRDLERRHVPLVSADMPDDEILGLCEPGDYRPRAVSIWKALLAELAGGENHLHVYYVEEEVDGQKAGRWRVEVSWRVKPKLFSQVDTVLLFDATPNITALRAHFPDLEVVEFDAPAQNTHVVQVADSAGKRSSLLNPIDKAKTPKKWADAEKKYAKRRERMAAWLCAQPGYTVVVTKKDYRELMERDFTFERVLFAHFGAVQGRDTWEFPDGTRLKGSEIDNLILLGRNTPLPYVMESQARPHHCDEDALLQMGGWYREVPVELAQGVAGVKLVHDDPRVDACFRAVWKDTQMQAFGRGRSVRRSKRLRVFILHNMPLDVTVSEVVSSAQVMRRAGDVVLLSPKEVDRVFGEGGRQTERIGVEANVKYWREDGQTQPYRARVAEGADVDAVMRDLGAVRWVAV